MSDIIDRLGDTELNTSSDVFHLRKDAIAEIERLRTEYTATLVRLRTLETHNFKLRTVVSLLSSSGAELLAAARNALEDE